MNTAAIALILVEEATNKMPEKNIINKLENELLGCSQSERKKVFEIRNKLVGKEDPKRR